RERFTDAMLGLCLIVGYAFVEVRGGVVETSGQRRKIRGSRAPRAALFGLPDGVMGAGAALLEPCAELSDLAHRSRRLCFRPQFTHPAADVRIAAHSPDNDPSEYQGNDEQDQQR